MTGVELAALLLACIGGLALAMVLLQAANLATDPEPPVGPWRQPPQRAESPQGLPRDYQNLLVGQAGEWRMPRSWERLCDDLDAIERDLGGTRTTPPAPPAFDSEWLAARLTHLEALAGPMPFDERTYPPPVRRPSIFARIVARFRPSPRA
ncbi:MAG: hypothetical protein AAF567_21865 [Actinomycetota bacterium]